MVKLTDYIRHNKELKTGVREAEWYELRRANWWEPFTRGGYGLGGARPYEEDNSNELKIKGQKVNSVKFYGLKTSEDFIPLRAVLEFDKDYFFMDRAVRATGEMVLFEPKTHKELKKITGWPNTLVMHCKNPGDANLLKEPALDKSPFADNVTLTEKIADNVSNLTLSEFYVTGNFTLAVGLLINSVTVIYEENRFFRLGTVELDQKNKSKLLGDSYKGSAPFYVIAVEGGTYKKEEPEHK